MSGHVLRKRLRAPSAKGDVFCDPSRREWINPDVLLETPSGEPTFAAVYRRLWSEVREDRNLQNSTRDSYESVMETRFLPLVNPIAFADMTEEDLLEAWDALLKSRPPKYVITEASIVIRAVMEEAYERNLTQVTLWGVPQYQPDAEGWADRYQASEDPEKEGGRLAELGVRVKKSMSLEVELRLVKLLLENCEQQGELLGALIMLFLGVRTSEATGFSWKHLKEMAPGYWALIRYDVSKQDSREVEGGGKTNNAFRILPVPTFLTTVLLRRREALRAENSEETVMEMPIVCKGEDRTCRCTQKELNRSLKPVYKAAGVEENVFFHAHWDMEENPEMADDCERSATAYLCRHQFATAMVYCGLTLGEIYTVMGHKEEDEDVKKADFSNPDQFRALADKMSRRPSTQIMDEVCRCHAYTYRGSTMLFLDDGDVEIRFEKAGRVRVTITAAESGDIPQITYEGFSVHREEAIIQPREKISDVISLRTDLWRCGDEVWDKAKETRMTILPPQSVIDFVESAPEVKVPVLEAAVEAPMVRAEILLRELPAAEMTEEGDLAGHSEESAGESCAEDTGGETAPDEGADDPLPAESGHAYMTGTEDLYLLDGSGRLRRISRLPADQRRDRRGTALTDAHDGRILVQDRAVAAYVLSQEGTLFRIPAGELLESLCETEGVSPTLEALRFGGVLFQSGVAAEEGAIVCLTNNGKMRKFDLSIIKRMPRIGRELVELQEGERIVSACICRKGGDVLLLTQKGMGLRLNMNDLMSPKNTGCQMIAGIELTDNDAAAVCVPYAEDGEYLFFKSGGGTVRWANTFSVMPHGRGSRGVCCVEVEDNDRLIGCVRAKEYVLACSNAGRCLCFKTDEVRAVSGPAQGVRAMRLSGAEKMASVVSIDCIVADCVGSEEDAIVGKE